MFRVLGILLSLYIVHCLLKGAVYAKAGIWGRTIERAADPWGYWAHSARTLRYHLRSC